MELTLTCASQTTGLPSSWTTANDGVGIALNSSAGSTCRSASAAIAHSCAYQAGMPGSLCEATTEGPNTARSACAAIDILSCTTASKLPPSAATCSGNTEVTT